MHQGCHLSYSKVLSDPNCPKISSIVVKGSLLKILKGFFKKLKAKEVIDFFP